MNFLRDVIAGVFSEWGENLLCGLLAYVVTFIWRHYNTELVGLVIAVLAVSGFFWLISVLPGWVTLLLIIAVSWLA